MARDPERMRHVGDLLRPDDARQLRVHRVVGVDRRLLEVDRAEIRALVVVDVPDLPAVQRDRHGAGDERRRGRDALLQRGRERDRLEGRARLALALDREVELALVEVASAEHGEHAAVARVDGDEGCRRPTVRGQPLRDRLPRDLLQVEIDRRPDLEPAAERPPGSVLVDEQLLDVVREVLRGALAPRQVHVLGAGERSREREPVLVARDVLLVEHVPEHARPPLPCQARVGNRIVERRVRGDPRQERRLRQGQRRGGLAEVDLCRLLDPVRAVAVVDRVQVRGQDPVLWPLLLELPRERGLLQLAPERALLAGECVLDELLRDR